MEVKRLFDALYYQRENFPQEISFTSLCDGNWKSYSTDDMISIGTKVSLGLLKMGVQPGDKIAVIVKENRPEWNILDFGISQIGAINVPIYPTISPGEYEYIFNDAGIKICIAEKKDLKAKVDKIKDQVQSLQRIFTIDEVEGCENWSEILEMGESGDAQEVKAIADKVQPNDLATLIYTSGTTGLPKGVMLTHENVISNVIEVSAHMPLAPGMKALSFLPLCHIFERMVTYCYIYRGINVYYSSVDTLAQKLGSVKPHFFTTVPRLLEKVYEKVVNAGLENTGLKKKIFLWALKLAESYEYDKSPGLAMKIADKLVYSKLREKLGGNVVGIVTGSAPCPMNIARFFSAAGVPIREGYGLTETSPVLTMGRFSKGDALLSTVGIAIDNVDLKIADDGEILAKGPNIMKGYYNKPEATAEVMSADGWFHTGDIGKFINGPGGKKFLKITDRKKQLLKTSGGKYVAPAPIENKFKESFFVEQMMVVGESKKFVSALIVPTFETLKDWARGQGVEFTTNAELIKDEKVIRKFKEIIEEYNPGFSHIEQIKKFKLLSNEWTDLSGELTPTMKVKRKVIRERYLKEINEIYGV
ncbi:MAG: long-chain fatty acid--CoA ligase [Bacteroidetes bacterium]|nr:long-chain fatty acid--CoA ligase [Bacteroidota bacterium]